MSTRNDPFCEAGPGLPTEAFCLVLAFRAAGPEDIGRRGVSVRDTDATVYGLVLVSDGPSPDETEA